MMLFVEVDADGQQHFANCCDVRRVIDVKIAQQPHRQLEVIFVVCVNCNRGDDFEGRGRVANGKIFQIFEYFFKDGRTFGKIFDTPASRDYVFFIFVAARQQQNWYLFNQEFVRRAQTTYFVVKEIDDFAILRISETQNNQVIFIFRQQFVYHSEKLKITFGV